MNTRICNSNNEIGLLKSVGPYRIPTADMSIKGLILPTVQNFAAPVVVGSVNIYGAQVGRPYTTDESTEADEEHSMASIVLSPHFRVNLEDAGG